MSGVTIETSLLRSTRYCLNLLFHMFPYNKALKVSKLQGCRSCRNWLSSLEGVKFARGAKVEKVAKSDLQTLKISRLQRLQNRLFSFDHIELKKPGGGGGVINTNALNCNQLLNISKTVQLIFTKLVSHFRQLSRVLSKWQVFLGFFLIMSYFKSDDGETW